MIFYQPHLSYYRFISSGTSVFKVLDYTRCLCGHRGVEPQPCFLRKPLSPVSYMPHRYHPRSHPRPCNGLDHRLYKKRRLPLHHRLKWWPVWVTLPLAPLGEQVYSLLRLFNDLPSHENTGAAGEDRTRI